jgi:hypothetical protein
VPCHPWCTHRTTLLEKRKLFLFSCGCLKFHSGSSFSFPVINVCNHGEHYETPCIPQEGEDDFWVREATIFRITTPCAPSDNWMHQKIEL